MVRYACVEEECMNEFVFTSWNLKGEPARCKGRVDKDTPAKEQTTRKGKQHGYSKTGTKGKYSK